MILEFRRQQHSIRITGPDLPGAPFTATLDYQFNTMPVILENANCSACVTIYNRPDSIMPIVTDVKNGNRSYPLRCRNWDFQNLGLQRPDEIVETFWYPDGVLCFFRNGELVARLSPIKPAKLIKSLLGNSRKSMEFECVDGTNISLLFIVFLWTLTPTGDA